MKLILGGLKGYSAGKLISIRNAPLLYGGLSWNIQNMFYWSFLLALLNFVGRFVSKTVYINNSNLTVMENVKKHFCRKSFPPFGKCGNFATCKRHRRLSLYRPMPIGVTYTELTVMIVSLDWSLVMSVDAVIQCEREFNLKPKVKYLEAALLLKNTR